MRDLMLGSRRHPSLPLAVAVTLVLVLAMVWLRVALYPHRLVPLSYALPLLIAWWHGRHWLLWVMAALFLPLAAVKVIIIVPAAAFDSGLQQAVFLLMQWLNILVPAVVLHVVLNYRASLERSYEDLSTAHAELQAGNEELAARDEELAWQNEELQAQTEELEQQTEELQSQAEELQSLHEALTGREGALDLLLRLSGPEADQQRLLEAICSLAASLLGPQVAAAAVLEQQDNRFHVRAHSGRDDGDSGEALPAQATLAALALEAGEVAQLEDTCVRPDLRFPAVPFAPRSVLAAPLALHGRPGGVLEVYAAQPGAWTRQQAETLKWLAVQCAQVWEGIRLREARLQAEADLRESEQRFRTLAQATFEGICISEQGRIRDCNEQFAELHGYDLQELLDQPLAKLLPESARPAVLEAIRAGRETILEHEILRRDGSQRIIETHVRTLPSRGRDLRIAAVRDITQRHTAELAMRQAQQAAEAASIAKGQFLANMSHELRTPMNAILGMTDLALAEELSPSVRDCLSTAKDSADTLLELVDQILDFSRIEAGRLPLETTEFRLRSLLDRTVKSLSLRAFEKRLALICDIAADVPDRLLGDPLRLRQVITNLLANAIKFTTVGEVVLRVVRAGAVVVERSDSRRAPGAEAESVRLEFSVSDTGIGMSMEDQERMFAPFTQADPSTTRQYGGTGLGLAISTRLVSLMGGTIGVESQLGAGSTFVCTVPLGCLPELPEETAAAANLRTALEDLPVLIGDSSASGRQALQRILAQWCMRPDTAADGPTLLARLHRQADEDRPFALIIVDAGLPGLDEFGLARLCHHCRPAIPLIVMLAPAERLAASKRGVEFGGEVVEKPVAESELLAAVARALGLSSRLAEGEARPALRHLPPPERTLRILLAEDTPANQKLARFLLEKRGHSVHVAHNGHQALQAVQSGDFDAVLMDVQMPVLDGFQATAAIRGLPDPSAAKLPIIAMTAHALKTDQDRCLTAGMDAYLSKPINAQALIELVEGLAQASAESRPRAACESPCSDAEAPLLSAMTISRSPAGDEPSGFDLQQAIQKCFGRYEMFQEMVGCLFDEAEASLNQMRDAVADGDGARVARLAHRLKGTLLYLAAEPAADLSARLEHFGGSGDLASAAATLLQLDNELTRLQRVLADHRLHGRPEQ